MGKVREEAGEAAERARHAQAAAEACPPSLYSHAPKDVLPLRICANYCAPYHPLSRFFRMDSISTSYMFEESNAARGSRRGRPRGGRARASWRHG